MEIYVHYYFIETFACLKKEEHVKKLLDAGMNGYAIGFSISAEVFKHVSPGRAIHALMIFLGIFRDCPRIFFTEINDKVLLKNIIEALHGFDRSEYGQGDYCFMRNNPPAALDVDSVIAALDYRITNCEYSKQCHRQRQDLKPKSVLIGMETLFHNDPTVAFAHNWAVPPEHTKQTVSALEWEPVPYPDHNDIMWAYMRNEECHTCESFYAFNKDHFIQNIGYATVFALRRAFTELDQTNPKIITNIIRTWLHACIDMYTRADERLVGGDRLYIPAPKTPVKTIEDISDYLIDILSGLTCFIVSKTVIQSAVLDYGSWINYFECATVFEKHGESLLAHTVAIRDFISPRDAQEGFAHVYVNLAFAQLFVDGCEEESEEFEGLLKIYENLSDADIYSTLLPPEVFESAKKTFKDILPLIELPSMPEPKSFPYVVELSFDSSLACLFARRILRQIPEYNRPQLAAARNIYDIPFVVQGEAFVIPMASTVHNPIARAIRFDAFTRLTCAAHPAKGDKVVQLVSQMCIFNKIERQHDYLYLHPRWTFGDHEEPAGTPDVYTGIINLSYADMEFTLTAAGRSAPLSSVKTGGYRRKTSENPEVIKVPPGMMLVYKREPAMSDERGLVSWQCRLSLTMEASETGVPYMQVSIAVYRQGKTNEHEVAQIEEALKIMKVCGVMKNHIYSGKQGWEKSRNRRATPGAKKRGGIIAKKNFIRRSMYPILYSQLTNANKNNTRQLFYENRIYLQRPKILENIWFQTVLLVYDEETEQERLVTPRTGVAFNEENGYIPEVQAMTFEEVSQYRADLSKAISNFSVGTTHKIVEDIYSRGEEEIKMKTDIIYSNNPPPLRNLHGLLKSRSDQYLTSMTAPEWELNISGQSFLQKLNANK